MTLNVLHLLFWCNYEHTDTIEDFAPGPNILFTRTHHWCETVRHTFVIRRKAHNIVFEMSWWDFNRSFCLFLREYEGHYLITVQLQIEISLVCVHTDVALLLHVLVAHGVVCNGICEIKNTLINGKKWNYRSSNLCYLACCANNVEFAQKMFTYASQFNFLLFSPDVMCSNFPLPSAMVMDWGHSVLPMT